MLAQNQLLSEDIRHLENAAERAFGVGNRAGLRFLAFAYQERITRSISSPLRLSRPSSSMPQTSGPAFSGRAATSAIWRRRSTRSPSRCIGLGTVCRAYAGQAFRHLLHVRGLFSCRRHIAVFRCLVHAHPRFSASCPPPACRRLRTPAGQPCVQLMQGSKRLGETVRDAKALDVLNAKNKSCPWPPNHPRAGKANRLDQVGRR